MGRQKRKMTDKQWHIALIVGGFVIAPIGLTLGMLLAHFTSR
jgi:hypothetical protein